MKPTIVDIGKAAGVSHATVSSVLSGRAKARRISPATSKRILEIARNVGYVGNHCARGLRLRRTNTLAMVTGSVDYSYLSELTVEIERAARNRGYHLSFGILRDEEDTNHYLKGFSSGHSDAIICASGVVVDGLTESTVPIVLLYGRHPDFDYVDLDLTQAFRLSTEHLLKRRRRRIAYVVYDAGQKYSKEMLSACRDVHEEYGVEFHSALVFESCNTYAIDEGHGRQLYDQANLLWGQIKSTSPGCDAIVTFNDDIALGLVRSIKADGLDVPGSIAVTAFNNTYPVCISETPLTSTQFSTELAGKIAIDIVVERLKEGSLGKMRGERRQEIIPATLVVRD